MKKFIIKTLGCKVNQYDSQTLRRYLEDLGFEYSKEEGAGIELAIVNSCAVTKTSIRKDRRTLALVRRNNPKAKLVLLGCWAQTYPEEMETVGVDISWGVGKLQELTKEVAKLFGKDENTVSFDTRSEFKITPPGQGERSRYFLKIQDGCEQFCSYCIIPYARGKLMSRPQEEVLREARMAALAGYDEIVLCGIHLGLYGKEVDSTACSLKELLTEMIKISKLKRVRLSSIEVNDVGDELLELMAASDKICKHLHFPLQAGNDKILDSMNRPYTTEYFAARVAKAREMMPEIALTTDVIVGFPGETDDDFKETMEFCKKIDFSRIHVFPFSAHEKTPAANMEHQISKEVKSDRAEQLRVLGEKMEKNYVKKFQGRTLPVIVERIDGEVCGKSEFYFDVKQKKSLLKDEAKLRVGKLVSLKME